MSKIITRRLLSIFLCAAIALSASGRVYAAEAIVTDTTVEDVPIVTEASEETDADMTEAPAEADADMTEAPAETDTDVADAPEETDADVTEAPEEIEAEIPETTEETVSSVTITEVPEEADADAVDEPEVPVAEEPVITEAPVVEEPVIDVTVQEQTPTGEYAVLGASTDVVLGTTIDHTARGFAERLYVNILGRQPDEAGLQHWTNVLLSGQRTAADVVLGFFGSPEYQSKGKSNDAIVTDFYNTVMGREPDAGGMAHWKDKLDVGMSYYTVAAGFVRSPEFQNLSNQYGIQAGTVASPYNRDKNYERTAFMSRLYLDCLGRPFDTSGIEHWCTVAQNGGTSAQIARGFIFSTEYKNKHTENDEYVEMMYRTFMDRASDAGGKAHWTNKLNYTNTREHVFNGFLGSPEYAARSARAGLKVGTAISAPGNTTAWRYNVEVLRLCNNERTSRSLESLTTRQDLWESVAMVRAREVQNTFSHSRPDGRSCWTAYDEAGISYSYAAENIAYGYGNPSAVVNGWMNSTGHRANILGPNTMLATGYYYGSRANWSQNFLTPFRSWHF